MKVLLMKQHAGIFPLHTVACLCNVYKYQNVTTVLLLSELRHFVVVRVCVRALQLFSTRLCPYRHHCSGRDSALILWWQAERELLRRETSRRVSRQDHLLTNMWQNTASILGKHKTYKLAFSLHKHKERCDIICLDPNI